MPNGLEIEKKYLIAMPDVAALIQKGATPSHIVQTYLDGGLGVSERVRKRTYENETVYTHTVKKHLGGIVRSEDETVITKAEYDSLLCRVERGTHPVEKTRYVLRENGYTYEFDVFPFWQDKAVLEIELPNETVEPLLPDYVTVLADVSTDKNYTNHALAKR